MVNWRTFGPCPLAFWLNYLRGIGSPLATAAAWTVAGEHSRFLLAVAMGESNGGTRFNRNRPENKNALNLRPPIIGYRPNGTAIRDPGDYMAFDDWADGVRAARERITDPAYGRGIYDRTTTVLEFAHVWAPASDDNDPAANAAGIEERIRSYPKEHPMAEIVYGRTDRPAIITMIVDKPYDGAGFTRVAPRQLVGACDHITDGEASLEWYHDFFSTGGQRQYDALTDYGIDKAGRIAMWNDPFGTRSPWASGGSDGLEGDGPLFVRTLGVHAINARLASIEHIGRSPAKMTDAQLESSAQLKAWHFDRARVPWSSFPLNPNVGCVTHMQHWEFATKPCPGAGIRGQTDALQNRIRALMKQAQEGESQQEIPPPEPIAPPHHRYPEGMDRNIATERFGMIRLHRAGKRMSHFGFHEGHAVCEAWLERGAKEQAYPEGADWWQFEDRPGITRHVVTFINGWVLWRSNAREGWRWM